MIKQLQHISNHRPMDTRARKTRHQFKCCSILACLLILSSPFRKHTAAQAQTIGPHIVEQYIEMGLSSNLALQQQQLDLEKSMRALDEARGLFLPSLELQARYSRAEGGRTFDMPIGDLMNPVYSTLNAILAIQGIPGSFSPIENETISFLREREQETKVRLIQPLFQPSIYFNREIRKDLVSSQEAAVRLYMRGLVRDIKAAYYQYIKAERAVDIFEATQNLVDENLRVNERLLRVQTVTEDAVFRARSEVLTVQQHTAEARKNRDLARAYFNFLLNRPLTEPIERIDEQDALLGEIETLYAVSGDTELDIDRLKNLAFFYRDEFRQLDGAISASARSIDLSRSAYLPSLLFVFDAGIQGEKYGFTSDHSFYMGSLVLSWNLFDGFQTRARAQTARLNQRKFEIQKEELEQQILLQVQESYDAVDVGLQHSLPSAEERVRAAAGSFRLISRKYEEGFETLVAFIDARTSLTQAEINLNITYTELLIRLAELEYATALYPLTVSTPRISSSN